MRGFTLIELLVVLFIITSMTFIAFPRLWSWMPKDDTAAVGAALRSLREEAMASKKETFFTADFGARQFRLKGAANGAGTKTIAMNDGELWEMFIPSRGSIKDGEVTVPFSVSVQEEIIALYLNKNGKENTIIFNNLSGEIDIEEGKKLFHD